jgi:hypothetical protein
LPDRIRKKMDNKVAAFFYGVCMLGLSLAPPLFAAERLFQESGFGYTMTYSQDWEYTKRSAHIIVFTKKEGADANLPVVGIQNLLSAKVKGGKHKDVNSVLADFENQLSVTKYARVYPSEPYLYNKKGLRLVGKQFVADYVFRDKNYRQWVAVIPRRDGEIFHAWVFSAPEDLYDKYLPNAKTMLDSLTISEQ